MSVGGLSSNIATLRMLEVLEMFAFGDASYGVTELSRTLGMTKNMVYRALSTLVEHGYITRSVNGTRYELGYGVLTLQNPNFPIPDFRAIAAPHMQELHDLNDFTVQLSIRARDYQLVIDGIESHGVTAVRTKIGILMPLHASAASRAILAALPDPQISDYLKRNAPLERFTETTLTEPEAVWREVHRIRERGYAEGLEDYNRGGSSLAFFVRGADGFPHGAVTIGGPKNVITPDVMTKFTAQITAIVEHLRREALLYDAR